VLQTDVRVQILILHNIGIQVFYELQEPDHYWPVFDIKHKPQHCQHLCIEAQSNLFLLSQGNRRPICINLLQLLFSEKWKIFEDGYGNKGETYSK